MAVIMTGFELNIIHNSNSQNSELAHVLALSIPEAKVDFKNRSILSKISFAMSLALIDMNDFQIIVYRYKFLKYLLTSKESTIHGERKEDLIECLCESFKSFSSLKLMGDLALYDILNEDRIRYKQGDFSNLSRTQRNYCLKKLNEIVYFENLIRCIDMVTNKYKYFVSKNDFISDNSRMMDLTFYGESKFQNSEYLNYNYLLAFIAAYCDELDKCLIFFKIANENAKAEWKIFINWNLAQIYGALGHVRDYVISYYNMQSDLKNLNEEQHRKLGTWVIEDIEINCKKIIENFNRNNYEISDLSDLNTMVFSMVFSKSKFNLSFEPNLLPNQMKNIQINKKIG
jgi:hypothetical protein